MQGNTCARTTRSNAHSPPPPLTLARSCSPFAQQSTPYLESLKQVQLRFKQSTLQEAARRSAEVSHEARRRKEAIDRVLKTEETNAVQGENESPASDVVRRATDQESAPTGTEGEGGDGAAHAADICGGDTVDADASEENTATVATDDGSEANESGEGDDGAPPDTVNSSAVAQPTKDSAAPLVSSATQASTETTTSEEDATQSMNPSESRNTGGEE